MPMSYSQVKEEKDIEVLRREVNQLHDYIGFVQRVANAVINDYGKRVGMSNANLGRLMDRYATLATQQPPGAEHKKQGQDS